MQFESKMPLYEWTENGVPVFDLPLFNYVIVRCHSPFNEMWRWFMCVYVCSMFIPFWFS